MRTEVRRPVSWRPWAVVAAIFVIVLGLGYILNRNRDERMVDAAREEATALSTRVMDDADEAKARVDAFFADATQLTTVDAPKRLVVEGLEFAQNEATLAPQAMTALDELADRLKVYPQLRVSLEAHTDDAGGPEQSKELSLARATTVRRALTARGITEDRMEVVGWGDEKPIESNATKAGRDANRRVEVVIIGAEPESVAH